MGELQGGSTVGGFPIIHEGNLVGRISDYVGKFGLGTTNRLVDANFNNITESGTYFIYGSSMTNAPSAPSGTGYLEVQRGTDDVKYVFQRFTYYTVASQSYVRTMNAGTWTAWQEEVKPSDLDTIKGSTILANLNNPPAVYKRTTRNYFTTKANGALNTPFNNAGYVDTFLDTAEWGVQTAYPSGVISGSARAFIRVKADNVWSHWSPLGHGDYMFGHNEAGNPTAWSKLPFRGDFYFAAVTASTFADNFHTSSSGKFVNHNPVGSDAFLQTGTINNVSNPYQYRRYVTGSNSSGWKMKYDEFTIKVATAPPTGTLQNGEQWQVY